MTQTQTSLSHHSRTWQVPLRELLSHLWQSIFLLSLRFPQSWQISVCFLLACYEPDAKRFFVVVCEIAKTSIFTRKFFSRNSSPDFSLARSYTPKHKDICRERKLMTPRCDSPSLFVLFLFSLRFSTPTRQQDVANVVNLRFTWHG